MKLSDIATATANEYNWLRQQVDNAPEGRTFGFDVCELPPGCSRSHSGLDFFKIAPGQYGMYVDEDIHYSGGNEAMMLLCGGEHLCFESFSKMTWFLQSLPTGPYSEESGQPQDFGWKIKED